MGGSILKHRACEGCGSRMAPWKPRHRTDGGSLVCDSCKQRTGTKQASNPKCEALHEGEAPPATHRVYGPLDSDEMYFACDEHVQAAKNFFPGREPRVEKIARAGRIIEQQPLIYNASGRVVAQATSGLPTLRVVAHDSGDGETIYHCPFCGAGAILGKSNGTAECQFCHTAFTVQVQPARSSVPQTIDGQPHIHPDLPGTAPGQESGQMPEDPAAQTAETTTPVEDPADEAKVYASRHFIAADGMAMPEQQYLKHLAITHADNPAGLLAEMRAIRQESQ